MTGGDLTTAANELDRAVVAFVSRHHFTERDVLALPLSKLYRRMKHIRELNP